MAHAFFDVRFRPRLLQTEGLPIVPLLVFFAVLVGNLNPVVVQGRAGLFRGGFPGQNLGQAGIQGVVVPLATGDPSLFNPSHSNRLVIPYVSKTFSAVIV